MADAKVRLPYRVKEVADLYGVSENFVLAEIREGRLKAAHKRGQKRFWWIKQEWLDEWAAGGMLAEPTNS